MERAWVVFEKKTVFFQTMFFFFFFFFQENTRPGLHCFFVQCIGFGVYSKRAWLPCSSLNGSAFTAFLWLMSHLVFHICGLFFFSISCSSEFGRHLLKLHTTERTLLWAPTPCFFVPWPTNALVFSCTVHHWSKALFFSRYH